jgi:hypothetical protein
MQYRKIIAQTLRVSFCHCRVESKSGRLSHCVNMHSGWLQHVTLRFSESTKDLASGKT